MTPRRVLNCFPLAVGLLMALSGDALASGSAGAEADIGSLLRHLLNLTVLLGFLFWALRRPLADFLTSRRLEVKDALDESWTAKASAEERYQQIEARIANFEGEIESLLTDVRADADMERKSIEGRAEQAAGQLEAAAKRSLDEELRRARRELRSEAISLAVGLAGDILTQSVGDDDQQRLTSDYLNKVGEVAQR